MRHWDYSTINLAVFRKLPLYQKPPTYRLQTDPGNGCHGDPPGYPSYFTQTVYTGSGNTVRRGSVEMVLAVDGDMRALWTNPRSYDYDRWTRMQKTLLRRLWKPLPVDHPRTLQWMRDLYTHFKGCLTCVMDGCEFHTRDKIVIPRTTPPQHGMDGFVSTAVHQIRKYYPEFDGFPDADIDGIVDSGAYKVLPPKRGDWWERVAEQPTPGTCVLSCPSWLRRYDGGQHSEGQRCQWCGFGYKEDE
jgi:hypothetical protein